MQKKSNLSVDNPLHGRIAIMTNGNLECIGTPLHLKKLYGSGFKITVKYTNKDLAVSFLTQLLDIYCEPWSFAATFVTGMIIELMPKQECSLADLFERIDNGKTVNGIDCWGLCQTTLEVNFYILN